MTLRKDWGFAAGSTGQREGDTILAVDTDSGKPDETTPARWKRSLNCSASAQAVWTVKVAGSLFTIAQLVEHWGSSQRFRVRVPVVGVRSPGDRG